MLKAGGVGLSPPEAFLFRTGRRRGKDLLGAPFKDGDTHPKAKNEFIDSFIGKSPAGSYREEPLVSTWMLAWAGGSQQPWPEVCQGGGRSLQPGAKFARTLLCPVVACPFTGHVLFTSLEALSLKGGQKPSV